MIYDLRFILKTYDFSKILKNQLSFKTSTLNFKLSTLNFNYQKSFRHIFDVRKFYKIFETIESLGIPAKNECLLLRSQFC